jgi:hypothetical protein
VTPLPKARFVRLKVECDRGCEGEHRAALRDLAPNGIYRVDHVLENDGMQRSYMLRGGGMAWYSDYLFEEMTS